MSEQTEQKKFELSPSVSIIIAGVIIAGAIVLTNMMPGSSGATLNNNKNGQQAVQQQLSSALYLALAEGLGVDKAKYQACVEAETYQDKVDADSAEAQKAGGQGTPFTLVYDTKTKKTLAFSGALPLAQIKAAIKSVDAEGVAATVRAPSADEHIIGSATAPIVLIEYSDYQCPYCQMIHQTLKQIVGESNGEIAWVYRHFPLYTIHPQAIPAAIASECIPTRYSRPSR
jgi:protein-disulfide isomerase